MHRLVTGGYIGHARFVGGILRLGSPLFPMQCGNLDSALSKYTASYRGTKASNHKSCMTTSGKNPPLLFGVGDVTIMTPSSPAAVFGTYRGRRVAVLNMWFVHVVDGSFVVLK